MRMNALLLLTFCHLISGCGIADSARDGENPAELAVAGAEVPASKLGGPKEGDKPESKLPDTPAGRQLTAWLAAFNSGNANTIRQYLAANLAEATIKEMPLQERVDRDLFVYRDTGGLTVATIEKAGDHEIVVVARMKQREHSVRITLKVAEAKPNPISDLGIRVLRAPPPRGLDQDKLSDSEISQQLADFLDKQAAADHFSGAVLVAKDGKAILERAYGLANRTTHIPNTIGTKFNLGSMNKMFTAVAVMQLVEQGKVAVTDTVGKHLPDYPNKNVASQVTIEQLLTHTSGLRDYFGPRFSARERPLEKVADFLPFFVDEPTAFAPGTKWQYSNAGYVVLGLIIEKLSGQSYYDYVQKHVYQPAGMVNTGHRFPEQEKATIAIGYSHETARGAGTGPRHENASTRPTLGSPAGGGYSTVHDLLRFDLALRDHRLLGAQLTASMTTAKKLDDSGFGYAYGFGNHVINGQRLFGHNGGAPGVGAQFDAYPELGYTVVILSNYDYRDIEPLVEKTRNLLARK